MSIIDSLVLTVLAASPSPFTQEVPTKWGTVAVMQGRGEYCMMLSREELSCFYDDREVCTEGLKELEESEREKYPSALWKGCPSRDELINALTK